MAGSSPTIRMGLPPCKGVKAPYCRRLGQLTMEIGWMSIVRAEGAAGPSIIVPPAEQVQVTLFLNGFLLRFSASSRYSATASQVVTQSRPTLTALIVPALQSLLRKPVLSPLRAAASFSEMSRSRSNSL